MSAKVESELNGMPDEEAAEWLEMLGVEAGEGGGLAALIRATYKTLGLQTYFTTGTWPGCGCARRELAASCPPVSGLFFGRLSTDLGSMLVQHCPLHNPDLFVGPVGRVICCCRRR